MTRAEGCAARDAGFTLVEVVVAMACVGIVMAALTAFVVTTGRATNLASGQQSAAQLGAEGIELVRSAAIGDLRAAVTSPNGRWVPPGPAGTEDPEQLLRNSVRYTRQWLVSSCWQPSTGGGCGAPAAGYLPFLKVTVTVSWQDGRCAQAQCSFTTWTLLANTANDPVFA